MDRLRDEVGFLRLQLDTMSVVDPETGLLNRNGMVDAIEVALERLDRLGEPFAVTGLRVPELPDFLLHEPASAGGVLAHVAALVRAGVRALDKAGRLDEATFVVLAATVDRTNELLQINRLRSILSAAPIGPQEVHREISPCLAAVIVEPGSSRPPEPAEILDVLLRALERATPDHPEAVLRV